ncbi:MAG: tetrathionate reductase family octaheme c-type cytochrome [Bacteroidales bacterium]|nr:tetrathionate reductase family octaheme c-type cytochrome [Bacteroidales bacterium]
MRKLSVIAFVLFLPLLLLALIQLNDTLNDPGVTVYNYVKKADRNMTPSVDHTQFEILQQPFEDAHKVTAACLSCHTNRHEEIMATSHWRWQRDEVLEGRGIIPLGKKNILNNFCIGIAGSEATCTRCHIGYGWVDQSFDFKEPTNVDCLICHDKTGTYQKEKGNGGYPKASVDLNYVSTHVGSPGRDNCGVCHFWGGGGNNVKHGDLEISLLDCTLEVDVHMATEGENMSCVDCHVTEKHQMAGKLYALSSENKSRATCEQCHTNKPHNDKIIDDHNLRVACQTCHIPVYAKVNDTKMYWDWSSAGELDEHGEAFHEPDVDGNHKYMSIKGTFVWANHVIPEYYWFNGIADHQLISDQIDTIPVQMNRLMGSYRDKGLFQESEQPSKIWPVKVHRGKQIYDMVNNTLVQPKLWAKEKGKNAFWLDFDWDASVKEGMAYLELPYSGEYGFVETEMYWPLNHMVSPASQSLKCIDCHTRNNSRLANLNDFYLPGRDTNWQVEASGITLIILSLIGVIIHAIFRVIFRRRYFLSKKFKEGNES